MLQKRVNLLRLTIWFSILALFTAIATPIYRHYQYKEDVSNVVSHFAQMKLNAFDYYLEHKSWPSKIDGVEARKILPSSIFPYVNNAYYDYQGNRAWFGYQLSKEYGSGWIFMLLISNKGTEFETYCGSFQEGCKDFGVCESFTYFPLGCTDKDLENINKQL